MPCRNTRIHQLAAARADTINKKPEIQNANLVPMVIECVYRRGSPAGRGGVDLCAARRASSQAIIHIHMSNDEMRDRLRGLGC